MNQLPLKINIFIFSLILILLSYNKVIHTIVMMLTLILITISGHFFNKSKQDSFNLRALYEIESITALSDKEMPYPEWLKFPDYERVVWINNILNVLWKPGLKEAVEKFIFNLLKKTIDERKNRLLGNMTLKSIYLGSKSPVITAVKIFKSKKCIACSKKISDSGHQCNPYCYVDFELINYNNKITFGTKTNAQFALENIEINIQLRIKLCDIVNTLPGFSKIEISVLKSPKMNFNLKALHVQLSSVPGIPKLINRYFKKDFLSDFIFPKFFPYELDVDTINFMRAAGKLNFYGSNISSRGVLKIFLKKINIKYLPKYEIAAYCIVKIQGQKLYQTSYFKSKNPKKSLTFDETIVFYGISEKTQINIIVVNENDKEKDEILGQCFIDLQKCVSNNLINDVSFDLEEVQNSLQPDQMGKLIADINYAPPNKKEIEEDENTNKKQKLPAKKKSFSIREPAFIIHIVIVQVIKAELHLRRKNKLIDACAFIHLGPFKMKTKIEQKSMNPFWNSYFRFEMPFLSTNEMIVSVFDVSSKSKSRLIGKAKIKFLDDDGLLLLDKNKKDWYPLISESDENDFQTIGGQILLGIDTQILNLSLGKKSFMAKKIKNADSLDISISSEIASSSSKPKTSLSIRHGSRYSKNETFSISIDILKARNLQLLCQENVEINSYVRIRINNNLHIVKTTRAIEKCSDPSWLETFYYKLEDKETNFIFEVINKGSNGSRKILSSKNIAIENISNFEDITQWYKLLPYPAESLVGESTIDLEPDNSEVAHSSSLGESQNGSREIQIESSGGKIMQKKNIQKTEKSKSMSENPFNSFRPPQTRQTSGAEAREAAGVDHQDSRWANDELVDVAKEENGGDEGNDSVSEMKNFEDQNAEKGFAEILISIVCLSNQKDAKTNTIGKEKMKNFFKKSMHLSQSNKKSASKSVAAFVTAPQEKSETVKPKEEYKDVLMIKSKVLPLFKENSTKRVQVRISKNFLYWKKEQSQNDKENMYKVDEKSSIELKDSKTLKVTIGGKSKIFVGEINQIDRFRQELISVINSQRTV